MAKLRVESAAVRMARKRLHGLGARLRLMWDDIVHEPVPDEMLEILKQIDERERRRSPTH